MQVEWPGILFVAKYIESECVVTCPFGPALFRARRAGGVDPVTRIAFDFSVSPSGRYVRSRVRGGEFGHRISAAALAVIARPADAGAWAALDEDLARGDDEDNSTREARGDDEYDLARSPGHMILAAVAEEDAAGVADAPAAFAERIVRLLGGSARSLTVVETPTGDLYADTATALSHGRGRDAPSTVLWDLLTDSRHRARLPRSAEWDSLALDRPGADARMEWAARAARGMAGAWGAWSEDVATACLRAAPQVRRHALRAIVRAACGADAADAADAAARTALKTVARAARRARVEPTARDLRAALPPAARDALDGRIAALVSALPPGVRDPVVDFALRRPLSALFSDGGESERGTR